MSFAPYVTVTLIGEPDEDGVCPVAIEAHPSLAPHQVLQILGGAAISYYEEMTGGRHDEGDGR